MDEAGEKDAHSRIRMTALSGASARGRLLVARFRKKWDRQRRREAPMRRTAGNACPEMLCCSIWAAHGQKKRRSTPVDNAAEIKRVIKASARDCR